MPKKSVLGPIPSDLFGTFIAVNPMAMDKVSGKLCNLNCIYCDMGETKVSSLDCQKAVRQIEPIVEEVKARVRKAWFPIDSLVIIGEGEATLLNGLDDLMFELKKIGPPVSVLTNGTRLNKANVRQWLTMADKIVLTLDVVDPVSYRRICRPLTDDVPCGQALLDSISEFNAGFRGDLCLLTVFLAKLNDHPDHLEGLQKAVEHIKPSGLHLTTVRRTAFNSTVRPVSEAFLKKAEKMLDKAVAPEQPYPLVSFKPKVTKKDGVLEAIAEFIHSRPASFADIADAFWLQESDLSEYLDCLMAERRIDCKGLHHGSYYTRMI